LAGHLFGLLQGEPLHHGSAGEVDPAHVVHLNHHYHDLVTDRDNVLGAAYGLF